MSKGLKKIAKSVTKVATLGAVGDGGWGSKAVGALSGGLVGDAGALGGVLGGVLGGGVVDNGAAKATDNLAKTQMQIAQNQANQASAEAVEQARASAQAIQLADERSKAQANADAAASGKEEKADVDLGGETGSATARRRKFNTASVSAGSGGPAIRI